jgi:hypothetical protein
MSQIEQLSSFVVRLSGLENFAANEIRRVVDEKSVWLADKNREYMAKKGEKVTGDQIQPRGYSRSYISYKLRFGRFKNVKYVDLKFDGDFHKSIRIEYQGKEGFALKWKFRATDKKYPELKQRYGDLLGIREKDLAEFMTKEVIPELKKSIGRYLKAA